MIHQVRCRVCGRVIDIPSRGGLITTNEWLEEQIGRHEATCDGPIVAGRIVN
jgi:hypothetical protein